LAGGATRIEVVQSLAIQGQRQGKDAVDILCLDTEGARGGEGGPRLQPGAVEREFKAGANEILELHMQGALGGNALLTGVGGAHPQAVRSVTDQAEIACGNPMDWTKLD